MNLLKTMEEFGVPDFGNKKILGFYEELFTEQLLPYCTEHYWSDNESINVFNVIGTAHPDYIGLTWNEFIHVGKRMKLNLSLLKTNPQYYLDKERKVPSMYYVEVDDKLYVDGDGNHRTALAKFFHYYNGSEPVLHGVIVKKYKIDYVLKEFVESTNSILQEKGYGYLKAKAQRKKISRDDSASWMRELFDIEIELENIITLKSIIMSKVKIKEDLRKLHKKGVISWFLNNGLFGGLL